MARNVTRVVLLAAFLVGWIAVPGMEAFGQAAPLPVTAPDGALPSSGLFDTAEKTLQDQETLSYYGAAEFVDDLYVDQPAFIVRISPTLTGELSSIAFPSYNGPLSDGGEAPGVRGTATLLIELFAASAPESLPNLADAGFAQREVPFDSLMADDQVPPDPFNVIDLLGEGFEVEAGLDYFVRLKLINPSEDAALTLLSDDGASSAQDPDYFPFRTAFYIRGEALREGEEEGYFVYENNANLVLDVTVEGDPPTAIGAPQADVPGQFVLKPNYPNPFNPTTTIAFGLPRGAAVTLSVYNLLGEEVARLVNGRLPAGSYEVTWNAEHLASGIYLARLQAGSFLQTRRMVLVK